MSSAIASFEYIQNQRAAPFSVREWVRGGAPGMLFLPYKAGQIQALRSMIATWMRLAIVEAMSREEDFDQRLWFIVDELDALGAIDGLKDALARLRKFGCRCVLGFQSIAQVSSTYGQSEAQTIVENCGNTLILRCSGSESGGTSQFASRLIGDREIVRRQVSRGSDREGGFAVRGSRRSRTTTEQIVTEAAVMPSELERLPDLCGYFKGASSPRWLKVTFAGHSSAS
jgi:type IV secretory pathway TraG/TraD family ATPase VirD4